MFEAGLLQVLARSQVLRFGATKYIFRGKDFFKVYFLLKKFLDTTKF